MTLWFIKVNDIGKKDQHLTQSSLVGATKFNTNTYQDGFCIFVFIHKYIVSQLVWLNSCPRENVLNVVNYMAPTKIFCKIAYVPTVVSSTYDSFMTTLDEQCQELKGIFFVQNICNLNMTCAPIASYNSIQIYVVVL